MLPAGRAVSWLLPGGPHNVPQATGSYQDEALGCHPSNLQPQSRAMISLHSPTAQNSLLHRHAQNSPSTCASRSPGFPLRHSNLGAVRHALRLVWSRLLQALHFTLMLSASKSHTLQAEEFFYMLSLYELLRTERCVYLNRFLSVIFPIKICSFLPP